MEQQLEVYLHGEGSKDPRKLTLHPGMNVKELIQRYLESSAGGGEILDEYDLYIEDIDERFDLEKSIEELGIQKRTHLHCHRSKHIDVIVIYNGRTIQKQFPPQTTFKKVLHWVLREFDISSADGKDLELRSGSTEGELIQNSEHIGSYVKFPAHTLTLYLTPERRVQG